MTEQLLWKPFTLTYITYPADDSLYSPLLALLSLFPPFGVCALTTATLIYKDVIAAFLLLGCLFSAFIGAILKRMIQQPRPDRYDNEDKNMEYGMPSNHSCFAWFCCTFVMMYVVKRGSMVAECQMPSRNCKGIIANTTKLHLAKNLTKIWNFMHNSLAIILALFIAIGCSYSRIYLGYHTLAQVYAGSCLGTILGISWYQLFEMKLVRNLLARVNGIITQLECQRQEDGKTD